MGARIRLVFGEDDYLVAQKAREAVASLLSPEEIGFGLETIDGRIDNGDQAVEAIGRCEQALRTVGFLGARKLVWLRDANFLDDGPIGRSADVRSRLDALAAFLKEGLPEGLALLVTSPKIDKRFAFYRACKDQAEVHEFAVSEKAYLNEDEARKRVAGLLQERGLRMAAPVLSAFVERVGTETRKLANELEKLAAYAGGRKEIGASDIEAVTCASRSAISWDLTDAFGERNLARAVRLARQLTFQGESPIGLVLQLESRVRDLVVFREAIDGGWLKVSGQGRRVHVEWQRLTPELEAAFTEGLPRDPRANHPFRLGVLAGQAQRFSRSELLAAQAALVAAHRDMVSTSMSPDMVLELVLVRTLSRRSASRRPAARAN